MVSHQIDERSQEEEKLLGSDNQILSGTKKEDEGQGSMDNQSSNLSIKEMRDDGEESFGFSEDKSNQETKPQKVTAHARGIS